MSDQTHQPAEPDPAEGYAQRRWRGREVRVFAAMDTMDQIAERVLGIVGEGRVMNKIATYVHDGGLADLRHLDHATGLHKGGHAGHPEGHQVWRSDDQAGFAVYLTHEYGGLGTMEGFGVGVSRYNAGTEKQVRARYEKAKTSDSVFDRRRDITYLEMRGCPGEPHRDDRIEVMDWNEHGVLRNTVITFVEPGYCDSGRITEANLLVVGYRRGLDGERPRFTDLGDPEVFATIPGPAPSREAADDALRKVTARDDVDTAWLVEEKVTRERRSIR